MCVHKLAAKPLLPECPFFPNPFLRENFLFGANLFYFLIICLNTREKLKAYDVVMQIRCITMEVRWRILPVCHTDQAQCYWYFCTLGSLVVFSFLCSFCPCHRELPNYVVRTSEAGLGSTFFSCLLFLCYCELPNFVI